MNTIVQHDGKPDTRRRILLEAERLFRHYGYSKTTVADIARELGMSPANVYRFFPSKLAINEAICAQMLEAFSAVSLRLANGPGTAVGRLRSILLAHHQMSVEMLVDELKVHEMVAVAMDEQWDSIKVHIRQETAILAQVISEGMLSGEIQPGDAQSLANCLHQGFMSWVHPLLMVQCLHDPDKARPEELLDFLLKALTAR